MIERVFTELTPECDITAQLYARGLEHKEIALRKFRALPTIRKQVATAYQTLEVTNRSQLTFKYFERITGVMVDKSKSMLSIILLCCFVGGFQSNYASRSQRRGNRVVRTMSRRQENSIEITF